MQLFKQRIDLPDAHKSHQRRVPRRLVLRGAPVDARCARVDRQREAAGRRFYGAYQFGDVRRVF